MKNYKEHTSCRVCNSDRLMPYLDLGMMPLSNNLAVSSLDPIHNQRYPLKVLLCEQCGLSQLSIVIPPEEMFSHYVYRSGISKGFIDHCRGMAKELKNRFGLNQSSFHVDIAGNDCTLLQQFREEIGLDVLNIDPAENLVGICEAAKIPTLCFFWNSITARKILNLHGKVDLITATNVFAHVDDVTGFLEAAKMTLKPSGILVMEFPYLIDFLENREFDTIYFEHLSYFSIYPIVLLCKQLGLTVMNVTKQDIHGGSVRVIIGFGEQDNTVNEFIKSERLKYSTIDPYNEFAEDVQLSILEFRNWMCNTGGTKAGFAASAKGNTLLNCAGITVGTMRYIVDQTPEKIGKYSPGTRIPIVAIEDMIRTPTDFIVILSWNFADEIMSKCRKFGYKGKFVIPIPKLKIID